MQRKNLIYPIIIFCICQASITYIIGMTTTNIGARYTAMMFMPSGSGTSALRLTYVSPSLTW
jgi:hypothetical protein